MFASQRTIVVNNETFYYKVSGHVNLAVQQKSTGVKKFWHEEVKTKWKVQIKPKFVEKFILENFYDSSV